MSLDSFISAWPVIVGILLLGAVAAVIWWRARTSVLNENVPLQRKSRIFSKAEATFYDTVVESLGEDFYVFTRVALLDVIEPSPRAVKADVRSIKARLKDQFFDYLVVKKYDLSIFGVIELENFEKNPDVRKRKQREMLISSVCKKANMKLFYFDVRQDYQGIDLYRLITGRASKAKKKQTDFNHHSQISIEDNPDKELTRLKSCPKCHSDVVTKVAIKGEHIGEKFLMCRKYPYCDYQVPVSQAEQTRARESAKQAAGSAGFKDWA